VKTAAQKLFSAVLLGALTLWPAEPAQATRRRRRRRRAIASEEVLPAEFGSLQSTQGDARVFALYGTRGAVRPLSDNVTRHAPDALFDDPDGYFLVDARDRDAAVQVLVDGREFVLVVRRNGAVEFGEILRESPAETLAPRAKSLCAAVGSHHDCAGAALSRGACRAVARRPRAHTAGIGMGPRPRRGCRDAPRASTARA
jgi:hypothetical protein